MIIIKSNMVFVSIYLVLMVNLARAEGNAFEPASQFYCDKVHEFLGYLGVENAADVGVYKFDVQKADKNDYCVRTGAVSGIWINEDMAVNNPCIKTEQDIIWRLAMAAVNYASGLDQIFLQAVGLRAISVMTIIANNVFLALLARCSCSKHYSLRFKLLAGVVANIGGIVAAAKLDKYLMEKIFWPNLQEQLKNDGICMIRMLRSHGYQEAAQAYTDSSGKYFTA